MRTLTLNERLEISGGWETNKHTFSDVVRSASYGGIVGLFLGMPLEMAVLSGGFSAVMLLAEELDAYWFNQKAVTLSYDLVSE